MIVELSRLGILRARCCSCRRLVLVFLTVLLLALPRAIGLCQPQPTQKIGRIADTNLYVSVPIPHQPLAMKRYRMLKQVERRIGNNPLYGSQESYLHVMFPRGRADKMYLVFVASYGAPDQVACYKAGRKEARLLYSVRLRIVNKPPKEGIQITSVGTYLSSVSWPPHIYPTPKVFSWATSGKISRAVRRDLARKQDLTDYRYQYPTQSLYVEPFSSHIERHGTQLPRQVFDVGALGDIDMPETKYVDQTKWYETYGLPVADCELTGDGKQE